MQAVIPIPALLRNHWQEEVKKSDASSEKQRAPPHVSRMWICLILNNSVIMGTYSWRRGDLPDSVIGNAIGRWYLQLKRRRVGFVTNMTTLTLYDSALKQNRKLMKTLLYLVSIAFIARHLELHTLSLVGLFANTLSVALGPLIILGELTKQNSNNNQRGNSSSSPAVAGANRGLLISAFLKSVIWLIYGVFKQAFPILISHSLGLFILSNVFLLLTLKEDKKH